MRYVYLAVSSIGILVALSSLLVFPRQSLHTDLKGSIATSLSEVKKISSDLDRIETEKSKRQMALAIILASIQFDPVLSANKGTGESPPAMKYPMYEGRQKEIADKVDAISNRLTDSLSKLSKLDESSKEQEENRKYFTHRFDCLESDVKKLLTESKSNQTNWVVVISLMISFLAMAAQWVPILIKASEGEKR
jgi:hypothetical protein